MRTIEKLINPEKKVFVAFKTEEECRSFLEEAESEGFMTCSHTKPTEMHTTDIIAVLPNKELCYVTYIGRVAIGAKARNVTYIKYSDIRNID